MRGKRWMAGVLAVGLSVLSAGPAVAHGARGQHRRHGESRTVTVGGAVTTPHTYTRDDLAALPQQSFTVGDRTGTGVSLEDLVNAAAPLLPDAKNASLRVTVTVTGAGFPVTFALGELDPGFGNHPAYLALGTGSRALRSPELIVPGDTWPLRTVRDVRSITIAVQSPTPTTPPSAGALTVEDHGRDVALTASQLAALPAQTLEVSFAAGTAPQTHTEIGPALATVLHAAHVHGTAAWTRGWPPSARTATSPPSPRRKRSSEASSCWYRSTRTVRRWPSRGGRRRRRQGRPLRVRCRQPGRRRWALGGAPAPARTPSLSGGRAPTAPTPSGRKARKPGHISGWLTRPDTLGPASPP